MCVSKKHTFYPDPLIVKSQQNRLELGTRPSCSTDLAVFEPGARHTFDSAVGKNSANPTAMLLSSVKLLEHLGLDADAAKIEGAVHKVLQEGQTKTRDLGGFASTQQFTAAVINNI